MKKVTSKDVIIDFIGLALVGVVAAVVLVLLVGFSSSAAENTYTCGYTYLQTPESGGQFYRSYDVKFSSQYPIFFINEKGSGFENYKVGTFDGKSAEIWSANTVNVQSYYMASYQSSNGNLYREETDWTGAVAGGVATISVNTAKGETFNANGYVFDSLDSATAYYLTGDISGLIQTPTIDVSELYNSDLPGVKNLSLSGLSMSECHGVNNTYNMCFNLSWDIPDNFQTGDFYTVKVLFKYNYNTYWSTARKYGSGFVDVSSFYSEPILIGSCSNDFCAHLFADNLDLPLVNSMDKVTAFTIENVQKIYIRSNREIDGNVYYGDWYIFNVNKDKTLSTDFNKPGLGDGFVIAGDVEIDPATGSFSEDTEIKQEIVAPEVDKSGFFAGIDFKDVSGTLSSFYSILEGLLGALGSFPALFASVFLFLPYEIRSAIVLLFYIAIIVGILKIFT